MSEGGVTGRDERISDETVELQTVEMKPDARRREHDGYAWFRIPEIDSLAAMCGAVPQQFIALMCDTCGVLVADSARHNTWHVAAVGAEGTQGP